MKRIYIILLLFLVSCSNQLVHDGLKRTYIIHIPSSYEKGSQVPLVIAFHGGGGNARDFEKSTNLDLASDRYGFIVAYPQGIGQKFLGKTYGIWNAATTPDYVDGVDDIGFISDMIDAISRRYDISKVYATGHSMGAQMSYGLACSLPDRISAIAPVGGIPPLDTFCQTSIPIIHIHGTLDPCIPYAGGTCGGCFDRITNTGSDKHKFSCDSVEGFIKKIADGQVKTSEINRQGYSCSSYGDDLELCTVPGMGHTWPGGNYGPVCDSPSSKNCILIKNTLGELSSIDGNSMIWDFFSTH